jgi:cobyrinic acid a,c-diamide synthase
MFLGEAIIVDGTTYPMVGLFPLTFQMKKKPQAHGYTIAEVTGMNPFYALGTVLHGHEFHYSEVTSIREKDGLTMAFTMRRGQGVVDKKDGICYKNTFGTYTHVHALGTREWVDGLITKAKEYRERNERRHA